MTLPDKAVAVLKENNGLVVDSDGNAIALLASMCGVKEPDRMRTSVEALRNQGLVHFSNRKIELTREGWKVADNSTNGQGGGGTANGIQVYPADPKKILRLGRRPSTCAHAVEAFISSGQPAARVTGFATKATTFATSVRNYLKKHKRGDIEVRVAGGELYLLSTKHADVISAKKEVEA